MSLTKATYSMIDGASINVLDYGADPTGATNSHAAITAAFSKSLAAANLNAVASNSSLVLKW